MAGRKYTPKRDMGRQKWQRDRFAAAAGDTERFTAAVGWFLSSVGYLARKGHPDETVRHARAAAAVRMMRQATQYLKEHAEAIDRGDTA